MTAVRSRVVTWFPPAPPSPALSGLQAVQAVAEGALPAPPFAALFGLATSHVESGLVRMALTPAEFHYNPIGSVHGGVAATMLETALAAAVRTMVPAGRTCLTLEIKVNYVRGMSVATGEVTAEGRVVHAGRQVAIAEGRVTDAAGRLYATATSTCLVTESPPPGGAPPASERRRLITWNDPVDSFQRMMGLPGLESIRDRNFAPPISMLLGTEMGAIERGRVSMTLLPGEHLFSQFGAVHGGITATLLDSALGCAVHSTQPAGKGFTTLEIKVSFLRAMNAASGLLTATGQVQHEGRRMAAAEASVVDAKGRLCATATTTCLVFDMRRPA
jgi:uncharacterized protein (TIGR00369 family)